MNRREFIASSAAALMAAPTSKAKQPQKREPWKFDVGPDSIPKRWCVTVHYGGGTKNGGTYGGETTVLSGDGEFPTEIEAALEKFKHVKPL